MLEVSSGGRRLQGEVKDNISKPITKLNRESGCRVELSGRFESFKRYAM